MTASTSKDTLEQYNAFFDKAQELFAKKGEDYGTSWTIMRPSSLTDQIYIKAARIRSIEEAGQQKIEDDIRDDYFGIINYGIMALIQENREDHTQVMDLNEIIQLYSQQRDIVCDLMQKKNHDYGEAWRSMRRSSMTDLILMKLLRIKSIEEGDGDLLVSEGIEGSYVDIVNYAIFALILLSEYKNPNPS